MMTYVVLGLKFGQSRKTHGPWELGELITIPEGHVLLHY